MDWTSARTIPLKLKHLQKKHPKGKRCAPRTSPSVGNAAPQGTGHRRLSYGPWWWVEYGSTRVYEGA